MNQPRSQLSGQGRQFLDRRRFLADSATALGSIALLDLLADDQLLADSPDIDPARPFAPRSSHFPARAKRVVVIFCAGAVSQLETWDYKPELIRQDGKPLKGGRRLRFRDRPGISRVPSTRFGSGAKLANGSAI